MEGRESERGRQCGEERMERKWVNDREVREGSEEEVMEAERERERERDG